MIRTTIPGIAEPISLLGFGQMRLPCRPDGKIDREAAQLMVDRAMAAGINYYDTAYPYHYGESELFIGEALKRYPRESFYLADKLPCWQIDSIADAERVFEKQLEKCGVEYFDYYLLHSLNRNTLANMVKLGIPQLMEKKKAQGLIRHLGCSFHDDTPTLQKTLDAYPWEFVQLQINYLDWIQGEAKTHYDMAVAKGMAVIIMEPVHGGMLAKLPQRAVELLHEKCPNETPASYALRFCAGLPGVLTVLSGMSTMDQLEENIGIFSQEDIALTPEEVDVAHTILEATFNEKTVPCTGCRYCMDCPFGVDIPGVFDLYNQFMVMDRYPPKAIAYNAMPEGQKATACQECGACETACPQQIAIIDKLKEAHSVLSPITGWD